MNIAPRASVSIAFGDGKLEVEYSLSPFGGDDTPRQLAIHRAESAGVDVLKVLTKPELDRIETYIRELLP